MSEPLVLSFKSDVSDARNAIANLASSVVTNMMTIGSAMKAANDNVGTLQSGLAKLPTILKTAAAAFVAFEAAKLAIGSVSKSIDEAQEKLKELVAVGQGARDAGVGTDMFQRWTSHAAELNTTAERLAATLQHARDAAQISIGEGGGPNQSPFQARLAQQLAAGNINAGDVSSYNGAGSQEERIRAVLNLVERLNQEGKALAALDIAGHFFGPDFEQRLRDGTTGVAKMREDLDGVTKAKWPPEMVQRAEELNRAIEKAKATMADGILPIQRDIANGQLDLLQYTKEWYEFWGRVLDTAGRVYTAVKDIGAKFDELSHSAFFSELKKLGDLYDRATGAVARSGARTGYALGLRGLPQEYESDALQLDRANEAAGTSERPLTVRVGRKDRSRPLPKKDTSSDSGADEVDTYIKSLEKAVEVLKAENDTFGKSNTLKAEAVDLEKALAAARTRGTPLTDEERAKVKALADEEGRAKDKAEELRKSLEGANARATFLGDQAISAIERIGQSGVRAKDVILDFAKALEKAALQAALLGTGPLAQLFGTGGTQGNVGGLFGGLFGGSGLFSGMGGGSAASSYASAAASAAPGMYGPGFASGGLVGRDGEQTFIPFAALAGARHFATGGGIPAILHPGEIVLNAAQQGNVADKMGGGTTVHYSPTVNGSDLTKEQLLTVLNEHGRQIVNKVQRNFGPMQADYARRHG